MINKEEDYRDKVLAACDEGLISYQDIAEAAMKWMSDDEVKEMIHANELDEDIPELSQEEKDDFEL